MLLNKGIHFFSCIISKVSFCSEVVCLEIDFLGVPKGENPVHFTQPPLPSSISVYPFLSRPSLKNLLFEIFNIFFLEKGQQFRPTGSSNFSSH